LARPPLTPPWNVPPEAPDRRSEGRWLGSLLAWNAVLKQGRSRADRLSPSPRVDPGMPCGMPCGMPQRFAVGSSREQGVTVVAVEGEVDLHEALVMEAVIAAAETPVVVDLTEVEFLGVRGLHALMVGREKVAQRDERFVVVYRPESSVARLFAVVGATRIFVTVTDRSDAMAMAARQDRRMRPDRRRPQHPPT
jgi:anti-anti-sigma factor